MPWSKHRPRQTFGETATLRKPGISLSSRFIEHNSLMDYEWVELWIDDDLRRIGFKFCATQTADSLRISKESSKGRMIYTSLVKTTKWTADILEEPTSHRRFLIETDDSVETPTEGVKHYISLGYRFEPKREFEKERDHPELAVVYRLFKDGSIVRIGQTENLRKRFKQHLSEYKDEVDEYDLAEIPDAAARRREEARLLEEFRDAHGTLPKLKPIGS